MAHSEKSLKRFCPQILGFAKQTMLLVQTMLIVQIGAIRKAPTVLLWHISVSHHTAREDKETNHYIHPILTSPHQLLLYKFISAVHQNL